MSCSQSGSRAGKWREPQETQLVITSLYGTPAKPDLNHEKTQSHGSHVCHVMNGRECPRQFIYRNHRAKRALRGTLNIGKWVEMMNSS